MKNKIAVAAIVSTLALAMLPFAVMGNTLTKEISKIKTTVPNNIISADDAGKIGAKMLPVGSVLIHLQKDEESYTLKYYGTPTHELYNICLSADNGSLQKIETQVYLPPADKTSGINLKETAIHQIVKNEIKEAKIVNTELDTINGELLYIIRFKTPTLYGNYTINAKSGFIQDRVIKTGKAFPHEASTNYISLSTLKNNVQDEVPGGILSDVNIKGMHGTVNYQVEVYKGNMQHNLVFNAFSGKLISQNSHLDGWKDNNYQLVWNYKEYHPFNLLPDTISSLVVDTASAVEIAKRKAPQGILTKIKLYYQNNTGIYEGKLENGDLEYDFQIDALSGKMLYSGGDYKR